MSTYETYSESKTYTVTVSAKDRNGDQKPYSDVLNEAINMISAENEVNAALIKDKKPLTITQVVIVPGNPEVTEYKISLSD